MRIRGFVDVAERRRRVNVEIPGLKAISARTAARVPQIGHIGECAKDNDVFGRGGIERHRAGFIRQKHHGFRRDFTRQRGMRGLFDDRGIDGDWFVKVKLEFCT